MRDPNPYDQLSGRGGLTCLGRVISVDPDRRTARIKTIGVQSGMIGTEDLDLFDVPLQSAAAHPEGDEDTYIPRPGQIATIKFINSQPIIDGYFETPTFTSENGLRPNRVPLLPGDRIIKMIAGNRLILRAGGTVEIESTKLCRTYWLPTTNTINSVCQRLEVEADGGFIDWDREDSDGTTRYRHMMYDNVDPAKAVDVEVGTAANGALLNVGIGDVDPDTAELRPEKLIEITTQPNGDTAINVGPSKVTLNIEAATGNIVMHTEGNITQSVKGNLTQTVTGNVAQTTEGTHTHTITGAAEIKALSTLVAQVEAALTVNANADATANVKGKLGIKVEGDTTIESQGNAQVKSAAQAEFSGTAQTQVGSAASPTLVQGSVVALGGAGGLPVASIGSSVVGIGNLGIITIGTIVSGSSKVTAT